MVGFLTHQSMPACWACLLHMPFNLKSWVILYILIPAMCLNTILPYHKFIHDFIFSIKWIIIIDWYWQLPCRCCNLKWRVFLSDLFESKYAVNTLKSGTNGQTIQTIMFFTSFDVSILFIQQSLMKLAY